MKSPNLFGVSDEVMRKIADWLAAREKMTAEEKLALLPPSELDRDFAGSAQLAVAQLCAEQPLLVVGGLFAASAIPVLMFAGWLFAR